MFLLRGSATDLRQGWSRRDCLRVGLVGALSWLGGPVVTGTALASSHGRSFGQAKSCILIYLFGGPSHIDIWDMKPGAPDHIRGEFKPISTNVPGIQITEHLPQLAQYADRYAIIRSMAHGDSSHGSSGHAMLTGRLPKVLGEVGPTADDFPHYGSVLAKLKPRPHAIAPFVAFPWAVYTSTNVVPGQTASFLGRTLDPFRLEVADLNDPHFAPPMTDLPGDVTARRLQERRQLFDQLGGLTPLRENVTAGDMDGLYDRAFRFLDAPEAKKAFCLDNESPRVRERYGRNVFGQSLLLARRLVEAGVPMITVYWPDRKEPEAFINNGVKDNVAVPAWDTHGKKVGNTPNFPSLKDKLLPALDLASTALIDDLSARGLLDQTLIVWTGEFGRSPRINGDAGRDHYGNVFSAMLAGGGIRGGQAYGQSDKHGAFPADNPVSPAAFAATLYHCLGIDPDATIPDRLGRPTPITDGRPVKALI
jgi:hypothetical protein